MDSLKEWVLGVLIKKGGPSAIRAGLVALTGLLVAHAGLLGALGITYDAGSHIVCLNLSTLEGWLTTIGLTAAGGLIVKIANYHAAEMVAPKA